MLICSFSSKTDPVINAAVFYFIIFTIVSYGLRRIIYHGSKYKVAATGNGQWAAKLNLDVAWVC